MEAMRERWTDERLDDTLQRVDADLRELRTDMNNRFEALQRLIIQVGGGLIGTMTVGFLSLVVTMVFTQH